MSVVNTLAAIACAAAVIGLLQWCIGADVLLLMLSGPG